MSNSLGYPNKKCTFAYRVVRRSKSQNISALALSLNRYHKSVTPSFQSDTQSDISFLIIRCKDTTIKRHGGQFARLSCMIPGGISLSASRDIFVRVPRYLRPCAAIPPPRGAGTLPQNIGRQSAVERIYFLFLLLIS